MDFDMPFAKTPATLDEITRVAHAPQRHPLCRKVQFDVVSMPRTRCGANWTVNLHSIEPRALFEASDTSPTSRWRMISPPRHSLFLFSSLDLDIARARLSLN
jgi:hypothetical protein